MKRIRRFSLSVNSNSREQATQAILSVNTGKIASRHDFPEFTMLVASVARENWRVIEDNVIPQFSRSLSGGVVGYTEVCEYSKSEIDQAEYCIVLFKNESIDLTQYYDFLTYDLSRGDRPRAWFIGKVEGSLAKIGNLSPGIFQSQGGLVASPRNFIMMYKDVLQHIVFDCIHDSETAKDTNWVSWWPVHSLPEYDVQTTGVAISGYAPHGVLGGGAAYCDRMDSGFFPVYKRSNIDSLARMGVHVARTRECYGVWPSVASDVKIAPQPRLVVSREFRLSVQSSHQRMIKYIPITIVD